MINPGLKRYITEKILPIYKQNDSGHRIEHIDYVMKRALLFSRQFSNIDINMIYAIASFHDVAHHIDKDTHEILSAKLFYEDKVMNHFFTDEQRLIIKEAIEDHRASLSREPRSDYGKIISSADRTTSVSSMLRRIHSYTIEHYPDLDLLQTIEKAYKHASRKYGSDGYAKNYCYDEDYIKFKQEIQTLLGNKWQFIKKYLEVNDIMDIKDKAKLFAINAHMGQVRKSESDKPMIMHPVSVGNILEKYGCDANVIAAGFLHDVVKDSNYTIYDIKKEFGDDVASLVIGSSDNDKALPWEERQKHIIEEIKKLPLRNKLVICADKINNLENLMLKFQKSGKRDFSVFKRGEKDQKWYYTNIYESLIHGENENLPMFKRFKDVLDTVFYEKTNLFLRDSIFYDNRIYYEKLKKLHAQKIELQNLKALCSLSKPFVIEFCGTPRTGKTTTINNLYDFFKKGGFDVAVIEDFATFKYYKENLKGKFDKMGVAGCNIAIVDEIYKQLKTALSLEKEIVLIDKSINDRQIWNYRSFLKGNMLEKQYLELKEKYRALSKKLIDILVVTYADSSLALKRDYNCNLYLEDRGFLNIENLEQYNKCLNDLIEFFEDSVENLILLDTTSMKMNDVSAQVASEILPIMRKKYIRSFEEKYNTK